MVGRKSVAVEHTVYDSLDEFYKEHLGEVVVMDWRDGQTGDWVLADDGTVMEILTHGIAGKRRYIRTLAGTFPVWGRGKLDSNFRENMYNFSGRTFERSLLSKREKVLVEFVGLGMDPVTAYLQLYRTTDIDIARQKVFGLLTKDKIMTALKETIKQAAEETGATLKWSMQKIKDTVDKSVDEKVQLRGAGMIADLHTKDKDTGPEPGAEGGEFAGFAELPPSREVPPPPIGPPIGPPPPQLPEQHVEDTTNSPGIN